jgi:hypothetical protein
MRGKRDVHGCKLVTACVKGSMVFVGGEYDVCEGGCNICEGSAMFHGVHSCRLAIACVARGDVSVKGV